MRPPLLADAERLAETQRRLRDHLAASSIHRDPDFYTTDGQLARLRAQLDQASRGALAPWLLLVGDRIVGDVAVSHIVLGPLRCGNLGYWLDPEWTGRGLATGAALQACAFARDELRLHRLEAGTLTENTASQRVLERAGFSRIGVARSYLFVNGRWRDHVLFEKVLDEQEPPG
ncbi:GNAT family N-acetyltransferase [Streptacidiphilus monticola]